MPKLFSSIRHLLPLTTLFFVVLTIVATTAVLVGWYVPVAILAASAVLTAGAYYYVGHYIATDESIYDWLVVAFVVVWTGVNGFLASEHIFTNRDPATYANTAIKLSRDQTLAMPQTHVFDDVKGATERSAGFTLNDTTDNIDAQGQHALPVVAGVFGGIVGEQYALRFNAVIGGVALVAVYLAARLYVRPQWALGAMGALGMTLPMMYFSRDMYTEPLAMLVAWTSLLFFVKAFEQRNSMSLWAMAGVTLGATALSRIDAGLFIVGVFAAVLFLQVATRQTAAVRRGVMVAIVASLPLVALALYDLWHHSRMYLEHHVSEISLQYIAVAVVAVITLLTAIAAPRTERLMEPVRSWFANPKLYAIGGILIALCVLGLIARPYIGSYQPVRPNAYVAQVERANGLTDTGSTSYRQYSVEWVSWYVGDAVLALGVIGVIALVASRLMRRRAPDALLLAVIGAAGWYLYSPSITPDQIWASRRFLVILIPGLIISAMIVLEYLVRRLPSIQYRQTYIITGFLFVIAPIIMTAEPLLRNQRLMLQYASIEQMCSQLPDNAAVLWLGMGRLEAVAPTRTICGVPAAGFSDSTKEDSPDNPTTGHLRQYATILRQQGYTPVVAVFEENIYTLDEVEVENGLTYVADRDYAALKPTIFGAPRDLQVVDSAIYAAEVMDDGSISSISSD